MKPETTLILGPPGCGKTYTLIKRVEEALEEGIHPSRICVVSFTTKAINEFIERACAKFNLTHKDFPYFKTLHAMGYHGLGLMRTDVLSREDYRTIGDKVGLIMNGKDNTSVDDGIPIPTIEGSGAKYLQMLMRRTYRKVELDWEYSYTGDYSLYFEKLEQLDRQIEEYKAANQKVDFADMIYRYVREVDPPHFDLLIVDEAQDLTPLQWEMVWKIGENSARVIIAGDDDQCIHRWTAVHVEDFINSSSNIEVLSQSYRLPRSVWEVAQKVSRRIPGRIDKEFLPRDEMGSVWRVFNLMDIPLYEGSWTIMARINSYVKDIAETLRERGYFYSVKGNPAVSNQTRDILSVWQDLQKGRSVAYHRIKEFYKAVPKRGEKAVLKHGAIKLLEAADPEGVLSYDNLQQEFGLIAPIDRDAMDVANLSHEERIYIRAIQRRGENINEPPRIKLSTIHAMKGGEDDNVVVYTGSTASCVEGKHPEDEHRVFYVGVTRARKNLYILESDKKYRYDI